MSLRPGRHGGMPSSELEALIVRNGNFLTVGRWGADGVPLEDCQAHVYNVITGESVMGLTSGWVPEYSRMRKLEYGCICNPTGICRTGAHGSGLIRGWRNILWELVHRGRVHKTKEIDRVLGHIEENVHPGHDPVGRNAEVWT